MLRDSRSPVFLIHNDVLPRPEGREFLGAILRGFKVYRLRDPLKTPIVTCLEDGNGGCIGCPSVRCRTQKRYRHMHRGVSARINQSTANGAETVGSYERTKQATME